MTVVAIHLGAPQNPRLWAVESVKAIADKGLEGGRALQRWVAPYTLVGKAIAGGYRIVVFSMFLPFVPASSRSTLIASLVVMLVTYAYESRVTLAELRAGQRTIR